jgi:hypothetical protein
MVDRLIAEFLFFIFLLKTVDKNGFIVDLERFHERKAKCQCSSGYALDRLQIF